MNIADRLDLELELQKGGDWLGAARAWMQSNIKDGDTLFWSSNQMVSLPFCQLEVFARRVALAAIISERNSIALKALREQEAADKKSKDGKTLGASRESDSGFSAHVR